ncbi:beta-N-acetylglucosaminidase domain-containing protein [Streptomyces sp. NPDC006879]|uniref:beta-N-acetylglucosaminidase domain-containing protein n=1 Tax=Streptomyces sp. NPDC006879 TaxID=3364767 RepID=UPI0036BD0B14
MAVAMAVIGGLAVGGPVGASAAIAAAVTAPVTQPDRPVGPLPTVWPRPQSLTATGHNVPLGAEATLVVPAGADPYAADALRSALRAAGVRTLHQRTPLEALPPTGTVIRAQGPDALTALTQLGATAPGDLPAGGYRIAVGRAGGRDTVALVGTDQDGFFHAVQTLRQLLPGGGRAGTPTGGTLPAVQIRDWPTAAVRGITEGFYGQPWSREQRLAQMDFMGRTKQNRYLYAPGDDAFRQDRWREDYPASQAQDFRALTERARANHVTFAWSVAPAQAMCLASAKDVAALLHKLDTMWSLGVRAFQLQFQDVSYTEWHCGADQDRFGSGPEAAARAHSAVANEVAAELARRHPDAAPLSVMPTEYYQEGTTPYRAALAKFLAPSIEVAWTGVGVLPRTITGGELAQARSVFGHPVATMDNYPVNDWAQDRLFLGPYTGRDPAVAGGSAALLANAMEQPAISRIPLFTAADFAWNPRGYQPRASWEAAIDELAGGDRRSRDALAALARNAASSSLGGSESGYLRPLIAEFWQARSSGNRTALDRAADRLRDSFAVMSQAPDRLTGPAEGTLAEEIGPWSEQLARYGRAGIHAVELLRAQAHGDGAGAWRGTLELRAVRAKIDAAPVTLGKGVLDPFLAKAAEESDAWTGASRSTGTVSKDAASFTVQMDRPRPVEAVTVMTGPGPDRGATVEAHVPGEGWRAIGRVSPSGWTQAATKGLRADAIRLAWAGQAPEVHKVVPWFEDEPDARLELGGGGRTDAEIGGGPQRVAAEISAVRPGDVRGTLTAKAPRGIEVKVPEQTTLPRGTKLAVPVEVTVPTGTPAGTYQVPVAFAGQQRVLTVRAFPRTGGPDLVPGSTPSSSADETPDFPAAAAADGDPETRWSSPAEDGAWWQTQLAAPVRLGRVVLHWQEAHASGYRIEVSADGQTWRTAAQVDDGPGGRESVRMDAPDSRYLRVSCDRRADARYGCSLFAVEAYAVEPERTPEESTAPED